MTLPVYPGRSMLKGLSYSSKWDSQFFVQKAVSATGAAVTALVAQNPLHSFELTYKFLRDGPAWGDVLSALEFRTMKGFHLAMQGSAGRFLYKNPDDYQVWQQPIGTGDGTTTTFTRVRTVGANGFFGTEPVGQVDTSAINVYLGVSAAPVLPSLYTISTANPVANTITFATAPTSGQAIAIDMAYWYYCMLANDNGQFEKFMHRLWSIGKVQISSCRPGT